jgi:U4/U6 small nuclear ribonucleoprotein PRP31
MASSLKGFGAANSSINLQANGLRTSGVGSTIGGPAGTQSSLAFTPVQGLELVDPKVREQLNRAREVEADRWFKGGTFTQVGDGPPRKKVDTGVGKMLPPPARPKE